jgi:hypothetical protein
VGVLISGGGADYPLWVLIGAPDADLRLEWIISGPPSTRYRDMSFEPCALVCERCPQEWEMYRDLPLVYGHSNFRLYLDED